MANLPYDKHSAASIFEYSKGLLGKSLRAFAREDYLPKKGRVALVRKNLPVCYRIVKCNKPIKVQGQSERI